MKFPTIMLVLGLLLFQTKTTLACLKFLSDPNTAAAYIDNLPWNPSSKNGFLKLSDENQDALQKLKRLGSRLDQTCMMAKLEQHKIELMIKDFARSTPSIPNFWKIFATSIQETPTSKAVETLRRAIIEQSRPTLDRLKRATYEDKFREAPELVKSAEIWLSRMDALAVIEKALIDPFPAETAQSEARKPERASDVQAIPSPSDSAKSAITEAATPQSTVSTEPISTIHERYLETFGSAPRQTAPEDKHQQPEGENPFQGDWCGPNQRAKSGDLKRLTGEQLWQALSSEHVRQPVKTSSSSHLKAQQILSTPDHDGPNPAIPAVATPENSIPTIYISTTSEAYLDEPGLGPGHTSLEEIYGQHAGGNNFQSYCDFPRYRWEAILESYGRAKGGGLEGIEGKELRDIVRSQFCKEDLRSTVPVALRGGTRMVSSTQPKNTIYVSDVGEVSLFHGVEGDRIPTQKALVVRKISQLAHLFPRCGFEGYPWENLIEEYPRAKGGGLEGLSEAEVREIVRSQFCLDKEPSYSMEAQQLLVRLSRGTMPFDLPEKQIIYVSDDGEIFLYDVVVGGKKEAGQSLVQELASEIVYLWRACDLVEYPWEMIIEELPRVEGGGLDGLRDEELREIVRSQWCE